MPYILSPIIKEDFQGMWFEGNPYKKDTIYDINSTDPKSPPVNYSAYTLKPHSLPHIEGAARLEELKTGMMNASGSELIPDRLLLSLESLPETTIGQHDPNFVLILSKEAAEYLVSNKNFSLYGTSWKSSDFMPGSKERPIHNTLFESAVIMECLDLKNVPEGQYFMNAFPIPLEGASESPVCPVLYTKEEILEQL